MIFVFWMLSFKPTFSLSSFTFIKRLFSSSSLSAIRVVSSAYLRYWYFSQQSWFQLVLNVVQNKILYPLNNLFQPTNSWQPQFFLFLWFLTVNGIIQLLSFCVLMFKLYPCCSMWQEFLYFFLSLFYILVYVYTTFPLSIHPSVDTWIASTSWLLRIRL